MEMSFSQSLRQTQSLAQSLRLSHEQRIVLQQVAFELRMELILAIRGEKFEPNAQCPKCYRKLTPIEILNGFNQDPNDFTTRCTSCGSRFQPDLICFGNGTKITLPFYCDCQTLAQMRGLETLSPEQMSREHPAIYRSAIVHHGGIRLAFAKLGIEYQFEEINDWKGKVTPFLGRMPDTVIASCANVTPASVRALRNKLGISKFTIRKALEEEGIA